MNQNSKTSGATSLNNMILVEDNENDTPPTDDEEYVA